MDAGQQQQQLTSLPDLPHSLLHRLLPLLQPADLARLAAT